MGRPETIENGEAKPEEGDTQMLGGLPSMGMRDEKLGVCLERLLFKPTEIADHRLSPWHL